MNLEEHAEAHGFQGLSRALFLARGGHAKGEGCTLWEDYGVCTSPYCEAPEYPASSVGLDCGECGSVIERRARLAPGATGATRGGA